MTAGFQSDEQVGPLGRLRESSKGISLRMEAAALLVPAFPDDTALLDDHSPHHGIGGGPARAPPR